MHCCNHLIVPFLGQQNEERHRVLVHSLIHCTELSVKEWLWNMNFLSSEANIGVHLSAFISILQYGVCNTMTQQIIVNQLADN